MSFILSWCWCGSGYLKLLCSDWLDLSFSTPTQNRTHSGPHTCHLTPLTKYSKETLNEENQHFPSPWNTFYIYIILSCIETLEGRIRHRGLTYHDIMLERLTPHHSVPLFSSRPGRRKALIDWKYFDKVPLSREQGLQGAQGPPGAGEQEDMSWDSPGPSHLLPGISL